MADKLILFGLAALLLTLAFASDARPARNKALDNLEQVEGTTR